MKVSRRDFLKYSSVMSASALLGKAIGVGTLSGCSSGHGGGNTQAHPNILLIMTDQMQTPPEGYGPDEGAAQGLKEILGFRTVASDNDYTKFFPGLLRLREHAVVLRRHYTASAACVPSRTCIMTGQYPSVTGADQTDGLYKSADDVPFLNPNGIPTIGDWFRSVGYTTHYFGKWHVSKAEPPDYLEPWGFSEWEKSYPEPHGGTADNTGTYRDVQFADNVVDFLKNKGEDSSGAPWFAVSSLVNPHDVSSWPINWETPMGTGVVPWTDYPPPPSIPAEGAKSRLGGEQSPQIYVDLNPDGFPQNNSTLPRTYTESLDNKPRCQKDYSLKWGLAIATNTNLNFAAGGIPYRSPLPFQLQGDYAAAWSLAYNQFYFYCHYLADLQLRRVLEALDDNGLKDNTIVVFLADHGDLTGAHGGMIQKWHNAYEEAIRVPLVISSPLVNENKREMREIHQPTSSIDFAPTLLALAGFDEEETRAVMQTIHGESVVLPFAGANLSPYVKGEDEGPIIASDGAIRTGVLFMTNDSITELGANNPGNSRVAGYEAFLANVDNHIRQGLPLARGPVRQPNNVRALCTGDWKIVHYIDPHGVEADEWELYCLTADPVEQTNLVNFMTGEVREDVAVTGITTEQLRTKNSALRAELARQEALVSG